jgi:sugar phosphate isomerase/epimerase
MGLNMHNLAIRMNEISRDPVTAIELAASWGIHDLELAGVWRTRVPNIEDGVADEIESALKTYDSRLICVSPGLFMSTAPTTEAAKSEIAARFEPCLPLCERFGIRLIIVFSFNRGQGATREFVVDQLGALSERAGREGITLVIEPIGGCYCRDGATLAEVVRGANSPYLRVNWDPGNIAGAGYLRAFPEEYEHVRGLVSYVHLKNWKVNEHGKGRCSVLNDGVIDYPAQIRALAADGYNGFLTIETHTREGGKWYGLVGASMFDSQVLSGLIEGIK